MTAQTLAFEYTGSRQRLVTTNLRGRITAYLWGGGGGGGGGDYSAAGGDGAGSGYSVTTFDVGPTDIIDISVGGGGKHGSGQRSSAAGGAGGASITVTGSLFWSTLDLVGSSYIHPTNGAYCPFLNTYGIWNTDVQSPTIDISTTIDFPTTTEYTFTASCDNSAKIYIDGVLLMTAPGFSSVYPGVKLLSAGSHTIRIIGTNSSGPGSVGLTIAGSDSFSGGNGGTGGSSGSSGAGGGGGGASAIIVNGRVVAVAAGGGGGGGGKNVAGSASAPGPNGRSNVTAGQSGGGGSLISGDYSGGGGGGGGIQAGRGGYWGGGSPQSPSTIRDQSGQPGASGSSVGNLAAQEGTARAPGGVTSTYHHLSSGFGGVGGLAQGQDGNDGYVLLVFDNVQSTAVNVDGTYQPVSKTWVNVNGTWQEVVATWINVGGEWIQLLSKYEPDSTTISGLFDVTPGQPPMYLRNGQWVWQP
jgi:hypothetical protein